MTCKILSDFDGVWTDQALEAEQVKIYMAAEAARVSGTSADTVRDDFRHFETQVKASPEGYGWAPDGRITAYVDEDPFCEANAIASYIDRTSGERERRYRSAILDAGFETLTAFADKCFLTATGEYRSQHAPALVPEARATLDLLHAAGVDMVVVSNSVSEKIVGWFRGVGIDAGEADGHLVRVRGAAGKQYIGETNACIELAGRSIHVDRPRYRKVIEEENPDMIVGDVFSLDLALPHVMRSEKHPAAPDMLVMRRHSHSPPWVVDSRAGGAIDRVIQGVGELVPLVKELAARAR